MKLTKTKLKQIIKEELRSILYEEQAGGFAREFEWVKEEDPSFNFKKFYADLKKAFPKKVSGDTWEYGERGMDNQFGIEHFQAWNDLREFNGLERLEPAKDMAGAMATSAYPEEPIDPEELGWVDVRTISLPSNVFVRKARYRPMKLKAPGRQSGGLSVYGTPQLMSFLKSLKSLPGAWYVGDLTELPGGRQTKHVSHQSGCGADISYPKKGGGTSASPDISKKGLPWEFTGINRTKGGPQIHAEFRDVNLNNIDLDALLNFLYHTQGYQDHPKVQKVIMWRKLQRPLQKRAEEIGMHEGTLYKIFGRGGIARWDSSRVHMDHLHIRMKGPCMHDRNADGRTDPGIDVFKKFLNWSS